MSPRKNPRARPSATDLPLALATHPPTAAHASQKARITSTIILVPRSVQGCRPEPRPTVRCQGMLRGSRSPAGRRAGRTAARGDGNAGDGRRCGEGGEPDDRSHGSCILSGGNTAVDTSGGPGPCWCRGSGATAPRPARRTLSGPPGVTWRLRARSLGCGSVWCRPRHEPETQPLALETARLCGYGVRPFESRSGRFPAQAVVVLADDRIAAAIYTVHARVRMGAEFARLIAVAGAGFGVAAGRWRRWRRRGFRRRRRCRRWGRLARREPDPGGALLAVCRHPDHHCYPDSGWDAGEREPERVQAGRVGTGRFIAVTGLEMRDGGNPRVRRGDDRDAHFVAGTGVPLGHRRGAGEGGWGRRSGRRWRWCRRAGDGRQWCAHAGGRRGLR